MTTALDILTTNLEPTDNPILHSLNIPASPNTLSLETPLPLFPINNSISTTSNLKLRSFNSPINDEDDIDFEYPNPIEIYALNSIEQRQLFVSGFMPTKYPKDIILLISNVWLDPQFKWSLGLLEWRIYKYKTEEIVKEIYGYTNDINYNMLNKINYGITKCITHKQFDINAVRKDIMETSPNKSWLVYFIIQQTLPNTTKGLELQREKCKIHNMLYQIVSPIHTPILDLHPTHSHSRDIRLMALNSLPSPPMGFELSTSMSMSLGSNINSPNTLNDTGNNLSPLSLSYDTVMNDIELDTSFILDTYKHEYPERFNNKNDTNRLQNLLLTWNRTPGISHSNIDDYICMDISETEMYKLGIDAMKIINENDMQLFGESNDHDSNPYIISKIIDIINRKGVIMNIINLFTELRMANHYIEMFKRKHREWIVNCASVSIEIEHCKNLPFEPFIYNNNVLTITEFLRNYPLFELIRSQSSKYDYIIHCIISTINHLINKIMRPLPFQPTYIINDSYCDYLMYTSQISRFIYNKIINQNRFNKFKYLDNIILNALHFPIQLDFLIIPQCVSEYKIKYQLNPSQLQTNNHKHKQSHQTNKLLFKFNNKLIGNLSEILNENNIEYSSFDIDREPAQFYKILTRGFDKIQKKNKLNTFDKRYQRYVFIIDRRNPGINNSYNGKYFLNNNEKNWKDKLYIFSPPKYNKISLNCDIMPEGFINRTMKYLLPTLNGNDAIGANCVCNGYIFCQSYHLLQENKIKKYFHYNGYTQRFTKDELKYYFPRLFMKINQKFQNQINCKNNKAHLKMFKEINDEEHIQFHQQTMK